VTSRTDPVPPALPIPARGAVVTVGTFDGVHLGHVDLLGQLVARARDRGCPSVVVTFEPHPLEIIRPAEAPRRLTMPDEKLERLVACGVHYVVVLPFTAALAALDATAFVDDILRARYGLAELLVGHDHGFGKGRLGDAETVRRLGDARGFDVRVLEPVQGSDGVPVSSTRIRTAIGAGDLATAAAALGRPYSVSGVVVGGDRRGRMLGFPTLNVAPPSPRKLLPPDGVYAVRVQTPRGTFGGMLNLGGRPTFGDPSRRLEAHLFDTDGDWYGSRVRIDLVARLRATRAFDGAEALRAQLGRDEASARRALG
jgi:riboflavin kinase/FMN adenylyltransferase